MLRRLTQLMYGGLLLASSTALFAQGGWTATPAQKASPERPAGPNASAEVCPDKVPDGGAPWFLRAETAEQRKARHRHFPGSGCDPDSTTVYSRFGHQYTIGKYEKQWAVYASGTTTMRTSSVRSAS